MMVHRLQGVWLKRDLRLNDHAALWEASQVGPVIAFYIIEPEVIEAADFDAVHWEFIADSLREMAEKLAPLNVELRIARGEAVESLRQLHSEFNFEAIWAHQETGLSHTFARDIRVRKWCRSVGVCLHELPQNGVIRGLKDRDGWARAWEKFMGESCQPVSEFKFQATCRIALPTIPTAEALGLKTQEGRSIDLRGGESQGHRMLRSFIEERGHRYHREMSSPLTAYRSCSRLSPYIAWGNLSMRSIVQAVRRAAGEGGMPKVAARSFLSRCHWHCHFMQKLESEPAIESRAFNPACDDLRADGNDTARLQAWQAGQTGYPFVDACMRALKARAWINFRMRAMLVSFAAYHLWLDFRVFRDWLARQFIDYEPGIHVSQIQMQSGLTGINTLRIYNPTKQGRDHDAEGNFIRRWVPELSQVAAADIHEPWKMPDMVQIQCACRIGDDYPHPIVDHLESVRFARAKFSELRRSEDYWNHSEAVLHKHGSRKGGVRNKRPKKSKTKNDRQTQLHLNEKSE